VLFVDFTRFRTQPLLCPLHAASDTAKCVGGVFCAASVLVGRITSECMTLAHLAVALASIRVGCSQLGFHQVEERVLLASQSAPAAGTMSSNCASAPTISACQSFDDWWQTGKVCRTNSRFADNRSSSYH